MKSLQRLLAVLFVFVSITVQAQVSQDAKSDSYRMKTFIDALISKMTLDEKIGQLNLPGAGDITTGGQASEDNSMIAKKIRDGKVGGLFNIKGVEKIKHVQEIASRESRLKIPLIFGMDVIHGYQTVFPIPLALSCSWDMQKIEQSARIAAIEASADGICWTFSPMVDIARDPRWGRIAEGNGEDPYLGYQIAKAMVKGYQGILSFLSSLALLVGVFLVGVAAGFERPALAAFETQVIPIEVATRGASWNPTRVPSIMAPEGSSITRPAAPARTSRTSRRVARPWLRRLRR